MNKIRELRKNLGISQRELEKNISFTQSQIAKWENGINQPTLPALIELANYFNCSIDYIAGRETEEGKIIVNNELSEEHLKLIKNYDKLNKYARTKLLAYIDGLLENPLATQTI